MLVIEAVVKEPSREKRQMYARILAQADTREWGAKVPRIHEVLRNLIDLTEGDFRVLNAVMARFRAIDATAPKNLPEETHLELYQVSVADVGRHLANGPALSLMGINVYLKRLARLGLLIELPLISANVDTGSYNPTHIMDDLMQILFVPAH